MLTPPDRATRIELADAEVILDRADPLRGIGTIG
jgi:hypothetical protein